MIDAGRKTRDLSIGCERLQRMTLHVIPAGETARLTELSIALARKHEEQQTMTEGVNKLLTTTQEECIKLRALLQVHSQSSCADISIVA